MFTHIYTCLRMFIYVHPRLPMFTHVYPCLLKFTYVYPRLPMFTHVYLCLLSLPMFTKFTHVY